MAWPGGLVEKRQASADARAAYAEEEDDADRRGRAGANRRGLVRQPPHAPMPGGVWRYISVGARGEQVGRGGGAIADAAAAAKAKAAAGSSGAGPSAPAISVASYTPFTSLANKVLKEFHKNSKPLPIETANKK